MTTYIKIKMTPKNERKLKSANLDIEVDVLDSSNKRLERINLLDYFATPTNDIYDEEESFWLMKM
jgi:hypothetical protein